MMYIFDSDPTHPQRPTMVFIHGNSSSHRAFIHQILHFYPHYRILAIDLPGHGKTPKANEKAEKDYHPLAIIQAVTKALKEKGITQAHFIGWSLGGHIAYGVAFEDPSLVASITTIGSPPIAFSKAGFNKGFSEWFVNELIPEWIKNPKAYSREQAILICNSIGFKPNDEKAIEDMMNTDPFVRKYLFSRLHENESKITNTALDGENFVHSTSLPLCLIVGQNDVGINTQCILDAQHKFKNKISKVNIIKDAPHAVFISHPNEFHNIVNDFINKVKAKHQLKCAL